MKISIFQKILRNIDLFSKLSPDMKRASKTGMKTLSMNPGCGFWTQFAKKHQWSLFDKNFDFSKNRKNSKFFF